jgi:hypothetical protein
MLANKSMSGAVGSNILSQAINKMKENNKYIGAGGMNGSGATSGHHGMSSESDGTSSHTTPISKHYNRYGH